MQNWKLAAGVAAAARARLGPAAKQLRPPEQPRARTPALPDTRTHTPLRITDAHTLASSTKQASALESGGVGTRAMERGGTFRRSLGSPGSSELLPRPRPPQPAPESQTGARGKAPGAPGAPARPSPQPTLPPRARHPGLGRGAQHPRGPREPEGRQCTDARRQVKAMEQKSN